MGRCLPAWVPPQMPNIGHIIAHQREMSICVLACPGYVWSGPGARPLPSPAGPLWAAWRNWEPRRVRNLGSVALESAGPAGGPIRKNGRRFAPKGGWSCSGCRFRRPSCHSVCFMARAQRRKGPNNGSIPTGSSGATRAKCSMDHSNHCCYYRTLRNP